MQIKFGHQSRAITQLKNNKKNIYIYIYIIVLTYILSISMHSQNVIKIHQLVHKILSIIEILSSIKGHNSVENERKILFDHPNLRLVNINAYPKF